MTAVGQTVQPKALSYKTLVIEKELNSRLCRNSKALVNGRAICAASMAMPASCQPTQGIFCGCVMQSRISDVEQASRYSFCRYMPARNSTVKYCFSDGVGRISSELLDEVLEALPFVPADSPQISAIQV